jgi:Secretion system C-terminal sorting domain
MKKIYLCALALSIGTVSFGQRTEVKTFSAEYPRALTQEDMPLKNFNTDANDKAPGSVIWSEDFTGGMPAGWTTGGIDGSNWVINAAAISATFTNTGPIASTSGGNHMLFFGETINPIADRDAYFQTTAIPLTGQASVTVQVEQKFRLCCAGAAALNLVVSSDPTFLSNVFTYDLRGAVAINAQSADPEVTSINITDGFGGFTGNIYIRVHWASGASHYYWMVDDMRVIESFDNDLIGGNGYYGFFGVPYTRIPADQIQPADFSMEVTNVGATDQTNTMLTVDVNGGGLFTSSSAPVTVPALVFGATVPTTQDSLVPLLQYTPLTATGVQHTITMNITSDSTDVSPANNTAAFNPFEITDSIYALDDFGAFFTPGEAGNDGPSGGFEFEAGNFFDIIQNDVANSITVVIGASTVANTVIDVVLYDITSGSFVEVDRSGFYTTTLADQGNAITLTLPNTPLVTAGSSYFAAVHTFTDFTYGTSGSSPDNNSPGGTTSLIFYPNMITPNTGENFFTTQTPMVRLNLDFILSVADLSENVEFSVYPNPSKGIFTLNFDVNGTENVALTVRNVVGQTVLTKTVTVSGATKEVISLENFDKGVYFLTIDNNSETKTVKLIVE